KLALTYSQVLNLEYEKISIDAGFFELGGHSLSAITLVNRMHKELEVKIEVSDIFVFPTIRELAEYIKTKTKERFLSIEKAEKLDYYKTSSAQERLYLLQQMEPDSTVYNMQQVVKLKDEIDSEKLAATFRKLIRRHESLRTSFHLINEEPAQEIHEPEDVEFAIECHELIEAGGKNHESQIIQGKQTAATIFERFIRPFDLSGAPLFRVGLIKIKAETATAISHLLIVDMHHIISDGASQQVLERDFARLYAGETLSPLQLQYRDFSQWQNRQRENDDMLRQAAFWKEEFSGEIPVLNLPTDFPRPAVQGFAGSTLNFEISGADVQGLKKLAGDYNATLYMVLLAAANVFFSRLSSQETIVIGTPTAGRGHADLEPIMGMFVNTLALKNNPQGKKSFSVFLQEVKTRTIKAFENQDYLFEDLVEAVVPRRDTSRNPLFDVMFTLANLDPITSRQVAADGALVSQQTSYKLEVDTAKFDLTFSAFETARKIFFSLEYRTDLFKEAAVKRFISYFKMVISSILKDREQEIGRLEILPDDEKQKVLYEFNDTAVDYPREKTVRELFEEQVERTPDNVAVVQIQDRGGSVAADVLKAGDVLSRGAFTYRELHERSNRLGRLLREKGVKTGTLVSIMVKRSIEMVLGILGILKAGGAFLPVDPQYPPKRIKDMLDDADPGILLTQESLKEKAIFNGECMELDDNSLYRGDCEKLENAGKPGDLIYAMYTSGSTGKSKGVLVEHRNVTRLIMNPDYIELSTKTRILQTGAPVFDATTFEIWGALLNGGQLYLVENEVILDAGRLKSTIKENKITTLWLTAPLFNQLTDQDYRIFSTLEYLLVGGDVLSPRHIEKVRNKYGNLKIINGYGPTENTTFSTTFLIDGEYRENIPIGKPISNSTAFIVDKYDRPQPIGVFGELLVGGDGVSRGYLNSPELTAEKFIERSFKSFTGNFTGHSSPITLYRTGDLARWLPDGNIDFSGRVDYQVKIRGFRIELGEIEIKLRKHEQIKEAVVLARAGDRGDKYLTAYLTAENTAKEVDQGDLSPEPKETGALPDENVPGISVSELREYLGRELPDYMIPSYFVLLDEFSLTENGKIDRKALPAPEGISLSSDADYAAPTGEIEEMLVGIWENVLGIKKIGSKENFFMAGGDSIKAIQVSARMNSAGYKVDMRDIFQYPTIAGLAPHVEKTSRVADQSPVSGEVLLTPIQKKHLQENQPHFHHFNQAVMFYSAADLEEEAVKAIFLKLQQHHDALRMIFTKNSDGTVVQFNREDGDAPLSLQVFDFRRSEKGKELLTREAGKIQASIDLQKGPLMKLGLFRLDDGDRLLVVIHHLVVDGVSWRILFEDITALFRQYGQHGNAGSFELPLKTDSFTNWSEAIRRYADSEKFLKEEKKYWAGLESITVPPLPRDFDGDVHNYVKDTAGLSFALEEAETEKLLTRVNQAFGTEINDILLTALSAAIGSSFGCPRVLVGLEGHGRESISTDIDISRTIGWFTGEFPVILDVSSTAGETGDALGQRIKEVKETLHRVPNNGIGYGILKYLTAAANKEEITFSLNPAVSFNYLGQFDDDVRKMDFQVAAESPGADQSPMLERRFDLDISGSIANKRLRMSVRYNSKNFKVETIETLLENYKEELLRIISYCAGREEKELTPSDMTYDNLSFDSLAALDNLVADIK
ncbi:MAG: amino acid adenylation domain-containing protein, partial [Candidatus Aminicenantes bacterium]|nr:amino acid adenylation domain-containing protein [Candidatus Aminicenantes bacterium]